MKGVFAVATGGQTVARSQLSLAVRIYMLKPSNFGDNFCKKEVIEERPAVWSCQGQPVDRYVN